MRRSRKPLWAFSRPSRVRITPPPLQARSRPQPEASGLDCCSLASDSLHRIERLLEPAPEVPLAGNGVKELRARGQRLHPEARVDKGAPAHVGEGEVDEGAGVDAADPHLAQLVEAVDDNVEILVAERSLGHLAIGAALLDPLALDLDDLRPPLRVTVDVSNEPPDDLQGGINPCLLAAIGH